MDGEGEGRTKIRAAQVSRYVRSGGRMEYQAIFYRFDLDWFARTGWWLSFSVDMGSGYEVRRGGTDGVTRSQ